MQIDPDIQIINLFKSLLAFKIVICLSLGALIECGKCPKEVDRRLILPCVCDDVVNNQIVCNSDKNFGLKRVFEYLTLTVDWRVRHFKRLIINAPELTELESVTFGEITFQEILILNARKLQRIHSHAFGKTRSSLKKLVITNANQLNTSSEYNFFDALSSMNNIHEIEVNGVNVNAIPDYAFRPLMGSQWNLTNITIYGNLQKVGNYAFYDPSYWITKISLGNEISFISAHAFDMRTVSHGTLIIDLSDNHLTADSFEAGVFLNSKRTLKLNLSNNRLTHFDEFIFEPFLESNLMNQIDIKDNTLVCDCRMKWLLKNKANYEKQIFNAVCADGRPLWSLSVDEVLECKVNDVITDG